MERILKTLLRERRGQQRRGVKRGRAQHVLERNIPPETPILLEVVHRFHSHCPNKSTKGFLEEPERLILELIYFFKCKNGEEYSEKEKQGRTSLIRYLNCSESTGIKMFRTGAGLQRQINGREQQMENYIQVHKILECLIRMPFQINSGKKTDFSINNIRYPSGKNKVVLLPHIIISR